MNGSHARPLSIQITFRFGNRSFSPFMIQFVRWIMLQVTNDSECTDTNRFSSRLIDAVVRPGVEAERQPALLERAVDAACTALR